MRIGIAGFIGAGKSAVARILVNRGYVVISADEEAHVLYRENANVRDQLASTFGSGILTSDGVNRLELGSLVFGNPEALLKLERIIHPVLAEHLFTKLGEASGHVFLEGALLPRWPELLKQLDQIWLVDAGIKVRLPRIVARGISEFEALQRIAKQNEFPAIIHSHLVRIINEKSLEDLQAQVETIIRDQLQ